MSARQGFIATIVGEQTVRQTVRISGAHKRTEQNVFSSYRRGSIKAISVYSHIRFSTSLADTEKNFPA